MILLSLVQSAQAFCGTYVGPVGSAFENVASQVVIAKNADEVVLTLAADVAGTERSFALLIPVPEALGEDDVSLASWELFEALDAFSAPRVVSYTCDDLYLDGAQSADTGDAEGGGGSNADGVTVEATFTEGAYTIHVLAAEGGDGLYSWLTDNGFELPASSVPILDEYIAAGQHFVAATVDLSADPLDPAYLEPLQLRYAASGSSFSLPIRIGTTVSTGEQDVVAYVLTDYADGRVGISNYPEAQLEDECMLPEGEDPAERFSADLAAAFESGRWLAEYAWSTQGCDPCSSEPPSAELLAEAGTTVGSPFLTRLRLRYTPEQATADAVLYASGLSESDQVRYITYAAELESEFEVCGVGMVEDGGSCEDGGLWGDPPSPEADSGAGVEDVFAGGGGCASAQAPLGLGLLAAAIAVTRRRRI